MLKMNSEIQVFCRVDNDINEIHTGHLKLWGCIVVHEVVNQFLKPVLLPVFLLEVIHCLENFDVTSFHETDSS